MIKIGHVSDIDKFTVPNCIKFDVITVLTTLDECYGTKRNIDSDMGGFVVICSNSERLNVPYLDLNSDTCEYTEVIGDYTKSLYISGSERNIVVYRKSN